MQGIISYALSKKYTEETAEAMGAVKGAPCVIQNIEYDGTEGTTTITFSWEDASGNEYTDQAVIHDGEKGDTGEAGADGLSIIAVRINNQGHVICIMSDTSTIDAGLAPSVPKGGTTGQVLTKTSNADGEVEWQDVEAGDSTLETNITSNVAVGGIPSGTTIAEGTTFTEFAQKILISELPPTIGFSITKSGNVVYGSSYVEVLTVSVSNMGTARKIKSIAWYEGTTLLQTDTIDSTTTGSWTYAMQTSTVDTTTFKAIVVYEKSDGAEVSVTKSASVNFYYNKFYGAVQSLTPNEATVTALSTSLGTAKGGTYTFNVTAGRICYAYPKSLGALTSIKDGNGFSLFDSFTRSEQRYTQNGTQVAYYRYVLTDAATVSGYNVTFA